MRSWLVRCRRLHHRAWINDGGWGEDAFPVPIDRQSCELTVGPAWGADTWDFYPMSGARACLLSGGRRMSIGFFGENTCEQITRRADGALWFSKAEGFGDFLGPCLVPARVIVELAFVQNPHPENCLLLSRVWFFLSKFCHNY